MAVIKTPRKIIQVQAAGSELVALSEDGLVFVWAIPRDGNVPEWLPLPALPPIEYTAEAVTL